MCYMYYFVGVKNYKIKYVWEYLVGVRLKTKSIWEEGIGKQPVWMITHNTLSTKDVNRKDCNQWGM